MERSEVESRVVKVVCQVLGVEPEMVKPESHFVFDLLDNVENDLLLVGQFAHVSDQRDHDFGLGAGNGVCGLDYCASLHFGDFGVVDTEPATAVSEHGVELVE